MASTKTRAAKLEKHLPSIRKDFRKVLQAHGLGDLHVSHFQLTAAADNSHDCGHWEDKCVDQDGHVVCGPVWVSTPC
jgi:hypothetical protein